MTRRANRCYSTAHRFYAGVDLHARTLYVHVLDRKGKTVFEQDLPADPKAFLAAIRPYRQDLVVGCECMFAWYWLADLCAAEGIPFALGHALAMRLTKKQRHTPLGGVGPGVVIFRQVVEAIRLFGPLLGFTKQLPEQLLGLRLSLFGEAHGLVLADRILDVAFFMQPVERVPIVALPSGSAKTLVASCEVQQSKNRFVNLVGINVHGRPTLRRPGSARLFATSPAPRPLPQRRGIGHVYPVVRSYGR
jgi:hypothetical protein